MRHLLALAVLFGCLGGCTAENPEYQGVGDAGVADLSGVDDVDLSNPADDVDLADPAKVDLAKPPECKAGARTCRTEGARSISRFCRAGFFADDRVCPSDSTCREGYCQVPTRVMNSVQGAACTTEGDCIRLNTDHTCTPFVQRINGNLVVETFCARPMVANQMGSAGTRCKPDDSSPCRTGFCDQVPYSVNGSDVNYCFRRCTRSFECPNRVGQTFTCRDSRTLVEGQTFTNSGGNAVENCIPN